MCVNLNDKCSVRFWSVLKDKKCIHLGKARLIRLGLNGFYRERI